MPGRKEQKEAVTYPASKRKAPPFKPQVPSKLPRISSAGSDESIRPSRPAAAAAKPRPKASTISKSESIILDSDSEGEAAAGPDADSDSDLPSISKITAREGVKVPTRASRNKKASVKPVSVPTLRSDASDEDEDISVAVPPAESLPVAVDNNVAVPQPLLLRLMHESFARKDTRIDKHAVIVLQKYLEVFVRETIARAALSKKGDVDAGVASQSDLDWLDHKDLEKVAGGVLFDF